MRSVLGVHWRDWCWSWNFNTLATWCGELTYLRDPDTGKDWRQEEKGTTEDEIVGWHHQHNGHGFGWTVGVGDGQGSMACCGSWCHKELDTTEWLNWTELNSYVNYLLLALILGKMWVLTQSSHVWLFATSWTVACQAPLSMGILQARILEWVAMSSSRWSSQSRVRTQISHISSGFFIVWATSAGKMWIIYLIIKPLISKQ